MPNTSFTEGMAIQVLAEETNSVRLFCFIGSGTSGW